MLNWQRTMKPQKPEQPEPVASLPDAELVHAARQGDKRAFVEIVARHQAMLCGIALGILGDIAAGEDASQEAFLTAHRRRLSNAKAGSSNRLGRIVALLGTKTNPLSLT